MIWHKGWGNTYNMILTHWPLVDAVVDNNNNFQTHIKYRQSWGFLVKLPSGEYHKTSLKISQHWFWHWLGVIRKQAVTWANVDPVVCLHMASLDLNVFSCMLQPVRNLVRKPPSTGQAQKMQILAERGHFKQWSASWNIASCHQISGHNVISSHFLIWVIIPKNWSKPIMENIKVPCNAQKLAMHGHFKHWTDYCTHLIGHNLSFRYLADIPQKDRHFVS